MPKSKNFNKVKRYYEKHFWTKKEVYDAVGAGWITADEYEEIVGEPYTIQE